MRRGLLIAAAVLVLDQISKAAILDLMAPPRAIEVLPVFNIVLAMNRGVSFSLFAGHANAPLLLSAVAVVLVAALLWWLKTATHPLTRTAIGLVIGGAVGNLVDRVRYGAVVDFLDVHCRITSYNVCYTKLLRAAALPCCWKAGTTGSSA